MSSHPGFSASTADLSLIARVRDAMDQYGMNQIDVMRDSGVSNSVLCLWLQNKYKGDNAKVNDRLWKWIDNIVPPLAASAASSPSSAASSSSSPSSSSPASSSMPSGSPRSSSSSFPLFLHPPAYQSQRHSQLEHLIPVRLDVTVGRQRYEDCFLWNLHESVITPRLFCSGLCSDVGLSSAAFLQPMMQQMKEQIKRYRRQIKDREDSIAASAALANAATDPAEAASASARGEGGTQPAVGGGDGDTAMLDAASGDAAVSTSAMSPASPSAAPSLPAPAAPASPSPPPPPAVPSASTRLLRISLDLTLDGLHLTDSFLWDPLHPQSSPEEYARILAADIGLTGEWAALIAWSIRDQLLAASTGSASAVEEVGWMEEDAVFRAGDGLQGWGPEVEELYDRLEHVDSVASGGGLGLGVDGSALTEYEREKEKARQQQRERRRQEKEKHKEKIALALQQQQQEEQSRQKIANAAAALRSAQAEQQQRSNTSTAAAAIYRSHLPHAAQSVQDAFRF